MANEQNLKPVKNHQEATMRGRNGGLKAAKSIRKKKELKEQFEIAIDIYTKKALKDQKVLLNEYNKELTDKGLKDKEKSILEKNIRLIKEQNNILSDSNILVLECLQIALNKNVKAETRLRANDTIFDRVHGKPKQAIDHTSDGKPIHAIIDWGDNED